MMSHPELLYEQTRSRQAELERELALRRLARAAEGGQHCPGRPRRLVGSRLWLAAALRGLAERIQPSGAEAWGTR